MSHDELKLVKAESNYGVALLFLILVLALLEGINGALNIYMIDRMNDEARERSKVTQEVVITVAACLTTAGENASKAEIARCVALQTQGRDR